MSELTSHAEHYPELSRHYLTPEQVNSVPYPPKGNLHSVHSTAHALVSERHDKGDLTRMVYALLVKADAELAAKDAELERLRKIEAAARVIVRERSTPMYYTHCSYRDLWGELLNALRSGREG